MAMGLPSQSHSRPSHTSIRAKYIPQSFYMDSYYCGLQLEIPATDPEKASKFSTLLMKESDFDVVLVGGRLTRPRRRHPQPNESDSGIENEKVVAFAAWVPSQSHRRHTHRTALRGVIQIQNDPGYSNLLMKEGFEYCGPSKPITLEDTTPHSRDVYAHQGFEIVQPHTLGQGAVDNCGLGTNDARHAPGFPVWAHFELFLGTTDLTRSFIVAGSCLTASYHTTVGRKKNALAAVRHASGKSPAPPRAWLQSRAHTVV
ncbi:hypothetical protein B0H12DRAFT_1069138 [Mycena haematopus]|nr:hypothetical protein B0H12DRAFT_1069138 [Mycena haematopus]